MTKGVAPRKLAESVAGQGLVVSLATVEPGNRIAEVRVYGDDQRWDCEIEADEYDDVEAAAEAEGEDIEERLLDALASSSASVVDDYERLVAPSSPSP